MTPPHFSIAWTALMVLIDTNVLVYAHRTDSPNHSAYRRWIEGQINSDQPFGMSELVLSSFLRIVTHPKIFRLPTSLETAMRFIADLRSRQNCVILAPGVRHWEIFERLCRETGAKGNLIPDAYLAALAIESGSEWITADRDFSRFPVLRWRHPLA
jgi:toxin-antitoxin system PIN domain toxin